MLGTLNEKARWISLDEIDEGQQHETSPEENAWLKQDWVYATPEEELDKQHIEVLTSSAKGEYSIRTIWGFTEIDGVRYHTRKGVCRRGKDVARANGIYTFVGELKGK